MGINDPFESLEFLTPSDRKSLAKLAVELRAENLVLFAGAGLSRNAVRKDGGQDRPPSWFQLAQALLSDLESASDAKPLSDDLLRIADYHEAKFGRQALVNRVIELIDDDEYNPGIVHKSIVHLNFREIITTNYDTLIERAFEEQCISPQIVAKGSDLVRPRRPPRIFKMNGCLKINPSSIVITGDDFLNWSDSRPLIELFVLKNFVESRVLFLGFSLQDPAFLSINQRVVSTLGKEAPLAYSIQFGVEPTQREYWQQAKHVNLIDLLGDGWSPRDTEVCADRLQQALAALARSRDDSWYGMEESVDHCQAIARTRSGSESWRTAEGLQGLLRIANSVCTLEDRIDNEVLLHLEQFLEAVAAEGRDVGRRRSEAHALATFVCLILAVVSAGERDSEQRSGRAEARAKGFLEKLAELCDQLESRRIPCDDLSLRSQFLLNLCLLGPIAELEEIVEVWTGPYSERCLVAEGGEAQFEPTPYEYRVPALGFHGVFFSDPEFFFRQAVESLWSRASLDSLKGSSCSQTHIENVHRYQYLIQSIRYEPRSLSSLPGGWVYHSRHEAVLGRLEMLPKKPDAKSSAQWLLLALLDLRRGWIFGSEDVPPSLGQAWKNARSELASGKGAKVPWEVLAIVTLAMRSEIMDAERDRLLLEAWRLGFLELEILIDLILIRLRASRRRPSADVDRKRHRWGLERPLGGRRQCLTLEKYEQSLVKLVRWIAERVAEEGSGELRRRWIEKLLQAIESWTVKPPSSDVASFMPDILAVLYLCDPDACRPRVEDWIRSQVRQRNLSDMNLGSLGLNLLEKRSGGRLLKPYQLKLVLALYGSDGAENTRFSQKLPGWLIGWCDNAALGKDERAAIARFLAQRVVGTPPDRYALWLGLAAKLRGCELILPLVERTLKQSGQGKSLYEFLEQRLLKLEEEWDARRMERVYRQLEQFAPFVADMSEDRLDRLLADIDFESLATDQLENAAAFFSELLRVSKQSEGKADFRTARRREWMSALEALLEKGVGGKGCLGAVAADLSRASRQALQDNLICALESRRNRRADAGAEPVEWIVSTILQAGEVVLSDLEEGLIEAVRSRDYRQSRSALAAVVELLEKVSGFRDRHQARLHRVRLSVSARDDIRPSSLFAHQLNHIDAPAAAVQFDLVPFPSGSREASGS